MKRCLLVRLGACALGFSVLGCHPRPPLYQPQAAPYSPPQTYAPPLGSSSYGGQSGSVSAPAAGSGARNPAPSAGYSPPAQPQYQGSGSR